MEALVESLVLLFLLIFVAEKIIRVRDWWLTRPLSARAMYGRKRQRRRGQ